MKKNIVAMLLAGGQGSRLGALTHKTAKPAIAFGGKYRIIDFPLSNCTNSGIDTVGVLTQYRPLLLNSYLGNGSAWDLDNAEGGLHILPPYYTETGGKWYEGTADAVFRNMDFLEKYNPEYVLILSGDQLYKMDYSKMLEFHKEKGAALTVSVIEVPMFEASRFGIMSVDEDMKITRFSEKPKKPDSNLASMGIYIFNWSVLRKALKSDHADEKSGKDFGGDVIPKMLKRGDPVYAYLFEGYWKDVGTIDSYYDTQMDLMVENPDFDLFEDDFRIYSNSNMYPPHFIGRRGRVSHSFICNGCTVLGAVRNSILSSDVYVGEDAVVEDSIVLPGARIEEKARISRAIIGENSVLKSGCLFDGHSSNTSNHIAVLGDNSVYPQEAAK